MNRTLQATETRALRRAYRRYVTQFFGYKYPGVIDRAHFRYMGYSAPASFREWRKSQVHYP